MNSSVFTEKMDTYLPWVKEYLFHKHSIGDSEKCQMLYKGLPWPGSFIFYFIKKNCFCSSLLVYHVLNFISYSF